MLLEIDLDESATLAWSFDLNELKTELFTGLDASAFS